MDTVVSEVSTIEMPKTSIQPSPTSPETSVRLTDPNAENGVLYLQKCTQKICFTGPPRGKVVFHSKTLETSRINWLKWVYSSGLNQFGHV